MSRYAEFRDASTTRDTLRAEAMATINSAGSSIDSTSNFEDGSRAVIVVSASDDRSVPDKNQWGIYDIFSELGMDGDDSSTTQNLKHVQTGATGHRFENTYPELMIGFLYDTLGYDSIVEGQDVRQDRDEALGTFTQFDQREFYPDYIDWNNQSYKDGAFYGRQNGWIYTPTACQGDGSENCRVHFVLHGCGAWARNMAQSGYNDLAAANDIIMVYPDVRCWDNEGDIDADNFDTNTGIVQSAIKAMVDRVTGTSSGGSTDGSTGGGSTDGSTDG